MEKVPAPWHLQGKGYILVYRFSADFVKRCSFLREEWMPWFKGGFGSIMLVDYHRSEAGPYRELLFIPGKFSFWGQKHYSISKIYVSTETSVQNGRANWAIPKELAEFDWQGDKKAEHIIISHPENQAAIADFRLQSKGPKFPVNTCIFPLSLGQEDSGRVLITHPYGKGWGRLAGLTDVTVNSRYFPDISGIKPWLACRMDLFQMVFPEARQLSAD